MVKDNILEFEKKHSKNLIELNEWLEKTKEQDSRKVKLDIPGYHTQDAKDEVEWAKKMKNEHGDSFKNLQEVLFLEESDLYKECGTLINCDPIYIKINDTGFEDIDHLKTVASYLTKDELKVRLSYENYMLLQTEGVIDDYLRHLEDRKVRANIAELRRRIKDLEDSLSTPSIEKQIDTIINKVR